MSTPAALIDHLRAARAELATAPWRRIVAGIDTAAARFLAPGDPLRRCALSALTEGAGLSGPGAAAAIDAIFAELRRGALEGLLYRELGGPDALDGFVARPGGGQTRLVGPGLVLHVLAGNVPAPGIMSIACGLLVKAANLVKPSHREPHLSPLFAQALAAADPVLGACVGTVQWDREDHQAGRAAVGAADAVIAYGADATIGLLQSWTRPRGRFLAYGHRLSLAAICRELLTGAPGRANGDTNCPLARIAASLAEDVALYDQQGCLSPLAVYIETGAEELVFQFGAAMARALAALEARWPTGKRQTEAAAAVHHLRGEYEMRELAGEPVRLWYDPRAAWTVIAAASPSLPESCLFRTLFVYGIPRLEGLRDVLLPLSGYLQGVALAGPPERAATLGALFGALGASRICPPGRLQRPPAAWPHDGRPRLLDLLHRVDIEPLD